LIKREKLLLTLTSLVLLFKLCKWNAINKDYFKVQLNICSKGTFRISNLL